MDVAISRSIACKPSGDIVAREIQGVIVILPLVSGIGDLEDELFTMNDTGKAIWQKLDGQRTLDDVIDELSAEYDAPEAEIQSDVIGLVEELMKRKMVVPIDQT